MGVVRLEGLEFFAYHGFYDEEQKIGNKYSVDVDVYTDFVKAAQHDSLGETVNYEKLYKIVSEAMATPTRLLETINYQIIGRVFKHFKNADKVKVSISKFNPPIGGVCRRAEVVMTKTRQEWEDIEMMKIENNSEREKK